MNINLVCGTYHHMEDDGALCICAGDTGGLGVRVVVSDRDRSEITSRAMPTTVLFCRTVMHESSVAHYGFLSQEDRRAFDRIVKLKGCGPGLAMKLLSVHGAEVLKLIVSTGDLAGLRVIPGVGPKMADKLMQELKL